METYINWYLLQLKAWCKKKICWIQIAAMCMVITLVSSISVPNKDNLLVGIANVKGTGSETITELLTGGDSLFSFQVYESEEELREDILKGRLECGFVFSNGFQEKLQQMDVEESVKYIQTPFSAKGSVVRETFYTAFLQVYSQQMLTQSMHSVYGEVREETLRELLENNQEYLAGDNLFQIVQESVETKNDVKQRQSRGPYPVRGVVALFLFAIIFMEHGQKFADDKAVLLKALNRRDRKVFEMTGYYAAATMTTITGLLLLLFSPESRGIVVETAFLLLYLFVTGVWVFWVGRLFRNRTSFMAWTATLLVTQVLVCPVFVDLSQYVEALRYVKLVFPMGIYLCL